MRPRVAVLAVVLAACGSAEEGAAPFLGTGGAPTVDAALVASGGTSSNGGAVETGGAVIASGGASNTGGTSVSTGGTTGSGGAPTTGGASPATGGVTSTGGTASAGGVAASSGGQPAASPWLPGGACAADAHGCGNRYGCAGVAECRPDGAWGKCISIGVGGAPEGEECPRACLSGVQCPL